MEMGGIILAGGRSRRMGTSKAMLPFGDQTMLERIVQIVAPTVAQTIVVAAPQQQLPELPSDVVVVHDRVPDCGPLEGIRGGLSALPTTASAAFICGCDMPLMRPEFIHEMFRQWTGWDIAVPIEGTHAHPLAAVYSRHVVPAIERLLAVGKRRPLDLFDAVATRWVDVRELRAIDPQLESLMNANHPEDYHALRARVGDSTRKHSADGGESEPEG